MLEAGVGYGTIDLNIKMCRPIPRGKELLAIGSVINISKNLDISDGKIVDEDGATLRPCNSHLYHYSSLKTKGTDNIQCLFHAKVNFNAA